MSTILLVEDDVTISDMLRVYLERDGYQVYFAADGEKALELFGKVSPDLVILDLNLPIKSGLEILPLMRGSSKCPILVLSARIWEDDRVTSLELGADDFIAKPFSARELMARIARHFARTPVVTSTNILEVGKVVVHLDKYLVLADDSEVKLTKTEFELLCHLMSHIWDVVARDTLMKEIIGYERYLSDRTIDTHMKNLRKKFEQYLEIETLRAVGYRLHAR